jgi:hypothetical protein
VEVTSLSLVLVKIYFYLFILIREVAVGKVTTHLCLPLIIKELKTSVEEGRVVTTLNIIKY